MSEPSPASLIDILPLSADLSNVSSLPTIIACAIIALGLVSILLHYGRRSLPYRRARLRRQLIRRQITARTAAHRLAQMPASNPDLKPQLDALRFARDEPSAQRLLDLLQNNR